MLSAGFAPNIRPIDLRKDLINVANLVELCFRETMDEEGRDYIRHIRQVARGIGGIFIEKTTPENSPLPFHGYVWEEKGKIIGNLTLIPVRRLNQNTYFIANVAVAPEFRGQGIAQQLTHRAVKHVKEHGGKKILLQVREDNPSAIHIYNSNGFLEDFRRSTWVWEAQPVQRRIVDPTLQVTGRTKDDWAQQRNWLQELYPSSISWNLPFSLERIKPGFWNWLNLFLSGRNIRSWSARSGEKLIGTATWENGMTSTEYIWLAASPAWEEKVIETLLPVISRNVFNPGKLAVNYPAARGIGAFTAAGMKKLHTLIWMSKDISVDFVEEEVA